MKVGTIVNGRFDEIPASAYTDFGMQAQAGQVYEVRIETAPMTPEKEAENIRVLNGLNVPGFRVTGVETRGSTITLQVQAVPSLGLIAIFATLVAAILPIIWPLIAFAVGSIFITRISEFTWAVIIVSGLGIFTYLALNKGKRKE